MVRENITIRHISRADVGTQDRAVETQEAAQVYTGNYA